MKKLILAVSFAFSGLALSAYDIVSATAPKGFVRSVTRTDYTVVSKFGEYFRTPEVKFVDVYNAAGLRTESSELTARGVLVNKIRNEYDAAGVLQSQTGFDGDGAQIWKNVITYANGLKTDSSEYGKDGALRGKTVYAYSGSSLTEETSYDADGKIVWKIVYQYNAGRPEAENEYFGDGSLDERRVFSYTPEGRRGDISYYDAGGALTRKDVFRYGADGSLGEITTYGSDGKTVTERLLIKYDAAGNISRTTTYHVAVKFGSVMNEMTEMTEISCQY